MVHVEIDTKDLGRIKRRVDRMRSGNGRVLIAVDGRGGSGKSTLARYLQEALEANALVEMDDFYHRSEDRETPPRSHGRNFDLDRIASSVLAPLQAGHSAKYQRYDWDLDDLAEWHSLEGGVVIVEGVYSSSQRLRDYFDLRLWVEAPYDVRLARGVARDGADMRHTWVEEWMPAEDRYVSDENPDASADVVFVGDGADGTADDRCHFRVARILEPGD